MDKWKPTLHVTEADLPAIKGYNLGDTYYALYKCKVVSKDIDKKGKVSGTLEVEQIKPVPHPQVSKIKDLIRK